MPGTPVNVGQAYFCLGKERTGETWEFVIEVFSDRSTRWLDTAGVRATYGEAAKIGPDAVKAAAKREGEFVVTVTISDQVYALVTEVQAYFAKGWDITPELSEKLNAELEEVFWSEVNPLLTRPVSLE